MTEIRTPYESDLDAMIDVMAQAFGLPFEPAKEIFYADPYFDIRRKQVLVEDGQVISCYSIVDSPLVIGKVVVPFAGIAGIATLPSHQGMGYARKLLSTLPETCKQLGYGFAGLFTDEPALYEKFGFALTGTQKQLIVSPTNVIVADTSNVRISVLADRPALRQMHAEAMNRRSGQRIRDNARWDYIEQWIQNRIVWDDGEVQGYALYELHKTQSGGELLTIVELVAQSAEARQGLVSFLAHLPNVEAITYTGTETEIERSGLINAQGNEHDEQLCINELPGLMVRIVDLNAAVKSICGNWNAFVGEVTFEMVGVEEEEAVCVAGDPVSVLVVPPPELAGGVAICCRVAPPF